MDRHSKAKAITRYTYIKDLVKSMRNKVKVPYRKTAMRVKYTYIYREIGRRRRGKSYAATLRLSQHLQQRTHIHTKSHRPTNIKSNSCNICMPTNTPLHLIPLTRALSQNVLKTTTINKHLFLHEEYIFLPASFLFSHPFTLSAYLMAFHTLYVIFLAFLRKLLMYFLLEDE